MKSIQDMFKDSLGKLERDQFDECIPGFDDIIKLEPLVAASYIQRGRANWEMHRWEQAQKDFSRGLELSPDNPDGQWTVGLIEMQLGNFEKGWNYYDRRWDSPTFKSPRLKTRLPEWRPHRGFQSVLVWCEQGIGDQILYGSLLNTVRSCTKKVTAMVDVRLVKLFQRAHPDVTFVPHDTRIKNSEYDSQIPIASIGKHFINTRDDIPRYRSKYFLRHDPARVVQTQHEIDLKSEDFVIGLSWASTAPRIDKHKSVALEELAGLWDIPNAKVINLQYGKAQEDIKPFEEKTGKIVHEFFTDNFFDLEGVAAAMSLCDVIVSVSNANVHIAGAMGKPVYVLDANKLWYWNHKVMDRSLFYPSVRLFPRDNMNAPWTEQIKQLIQEIKNDYTR